MTPVDKGKFCCSCSKTVVDFTNKKTDEIKEYLLKSKGESVCGHFHRKQLDSIVIQLPETTFNQSLSFQKLFILSLFFVMGTTLFSCKTDTGKIQKIDKIEVIDSIIKIDNSIDVLKIDTIINKKKCKTLPPPLPPIVPSIQAHEVSIGLPVLEEDFIEGEMEIEVINPYRLLAVDVPPRFKETKKMSNKLLIHEFGVAMYEFTVNNFNKEITKDLGLSSGKKSMYAQIVIDSFGNISDIDVRAPHLKLKEHFIEILQKLPQFIPAKKNGENVSVIYVLPISFKID